MNDNLGDKTVLRQYLLGNLNDDVVLTSIEKKLMTDDDFADEVSAAEDSLIEDYLDGTLTGGERQAFERYFLVSPERQGHLHLTADLKNISAKAEIFPRIKHSRFDWSPKLSSMQLRFGALAVILIVAGIFIWRFAIYRTDADRGLAELRTAFKGERPVESRITALPDYVPFSETRGAVAPATDASALDRAQRYLIDATQDPNDEKAHHALGLLYLAEGKLDQAQREFDKAEQLFPNDAALQGDIGAADVERARAAVGGNDAANVLVFADAALKHLDLAVSLDARLPEPYFNRALCLQISHQIVQAKQAWRKYLEIDPASKWADEARRNLELLEGRSALPPTSDELEAALLAACRENNEGKAADLISQDRETITGKYLPQRLAMSYIGAPDERRDELLNALKFVGNIEMRQTGDPFANEIAHFYASISPRQVRDLAPAEQQVSDADKICLESTGYDRALEYFRSAQTAFVRAGDQPEAMLATYSVAYALVNLNRANEAFTELQHVVDYAHANGFVWLEATAMHWVGNVYSKNGKHTLAKRAFERALGIAIKIDDPYAKQRNMIELARIASYGGQEKAALGYMLGAFAGSDRVGTSLRQKYRNSEVSVDILWNAGLNNFAYAAALESVSEADALQDPTFLATAPSNAGAAATRLGKYADGHAALSVGMENAERIPDPKYRARMTAVLSMKLGELENAEHSFGLAEHDFTNALNYFETAEMPFHREEARQGLLTSMMDEGKFDQVESQLPAMLEYTEAYRSGIRTEEERVGFFDARDNLYDIAADLEQRRGNYEKAFDYAEMSSSRALLDWLERGGTRTGSSVDLGEDARPESIVDIRQQMLPATQIVQYNVSGDHVLIWLVSRDKFRGYRVDIDWAELSKKVDLVVSGLSRPRIDDGEADIRIRRELYDLLISPIAADLDPQAEICIVPSKTLLDLPFAALLSPAGKAFIEDHDLVYAPSSNVYLHCTEMAAKKGGVVNEKLLGVGNPAFDQTQFPDLPYLVDAAAEINDLTAIYPHSDPLIGPQATKAAFLAAADSADIIQFAGHYVVANDDPSSSYMLFARNGDADNSKLTNMELAGRSFGRARLIVLSACRTGGEAAVNGEGMSGLARTFLAAAVPLVVASRWSVDSAATSQLMKRFHHFRRDEHLSTSAALQRAQIEMLTDPGGEFRDPYYWAGFSLYGGHADF